MKVEVQIRQMARSSYWQEIYTSSKNCSGIYLFENQSNFSGIQYLFLYWLRVYSMLYDELGSFEWENLDIKVELPKQKIHKNIPKNAALYSTQFFYKL